MPDYLQRLSSLEKRITTYNSKRREDNDAYVNLLKDVVAVVREADASAEPNLPKIVNKAGDIFDGAIDWAYGDGDFDFFPSFAHASSTISASSPKLPTRHPYFALSFNSPLTSPIAPLRSTHTPVSNPASVAGTWSWWSD